MNFNTYRKMVDRAARLAAQIERLESQGRAGTRDYGKLNAELSRTNARFNAATRTRSPIMDAIAAGVTFDWDSFDGMTNVQHHNH